MIYGPVSMIESHAAKDGFMTKGSSIQIDENSLTKGQRRKLNALRKSVGDEIGERAFAEWHSAQPASAGAETDEDAALITETLWPLVRQGTVAIPRGGYVLRRGRGRIIVEPARS